MEWEKHGVIWKPEGNIPWMKSHATCPTPLFMPNGNLRIYLQTRDAHNVGRILYVDVDGHDFKKVISISKKPVLDIGSPGCFDDNGVFPTSVVRIDEKTIYLYYVGFELCHHVRYRLFTGLAISTDGGESFTRYSNTPILDRIDGERYFRCGPFVRRKNDIFQMWYVSGDNWQVINGKSMPIYNLKYIESKDGIYWPGNGRTVLELNDNEEHGFGRPFIIDKHDSQDMYYSIRKIDPCEYRLGFATSNDGLSWQRKDEELNLTTSTDGWDCISVEYSTRITDLNGQDWLLYNGNNFGETGFGLAKAIT